jgi:pyroglutamyl-peptidase
MKKCLLTGFEPFLDHPINPTQEVVQALNKEIIGEYEVIGCILPVVFDEAGEKVLQLIEATKPDAVISLGLSAGRTKITPERVAINCRDGAIDNSGKRWEDATIEEEGDVAYFSSLPIRKMVNKMKEARLPAEVSNTAGTYVCNNVMYRTLHYLHRQGHTHIPAGFIHIPANHELTIHQPRYASWSTEDIINAIRLCIDTLDSK